METDEKTELLVIRACGISESEYAGIPKLLLTETTQSNLTDGILEFNFMIQGVKTGLKKKLEWDISVVYRMDTFPTGIKAIKVNARENADIAFLMNE